MGRKMQSNKGKEKRMARKEERQKIAQSMATVAKANGLEDPLQPFTAFKKFNRDGLIAEISCLRVGQLDSETLAWVLDLTERNMRKSYEQCSWGWNSENKHAEMTEDAAWYLLAKDPAGNNLGFSHFRFDMDYGDEVLYCYELQLEGTAHRKGLGSFMLHTLELIGFTNQMKKVVLTVLTNNKSAISFFKALRYTEDETNPDEEEEAPYEILSKYNPKMSKPPQQQQAVVSHNSKHQITAQALGIAAHPCCQGGHHH